MDQYAVVLTILFLLPDNEQGCVTLDPLLHFCNWDFLAVMKNYHCGVILKTCPGEIASTHPGTVALCDDYVSIQAILSGRDLVGPAVQLFGLDAVLILEIEPHLGMGITKVPRAIPFETDELLLAMANHVGAKSSALHGNHKVIRVKHPGNLVFHHLAILCDCVLVIDCEDGGRSSICPTRCHEGDREEHRNDDLNVHDTPPWRYWTRRIRMFVTFAAPGQLMSRVPLASSRMMPFFSNALLSCLQYPTLNQTLPLRLRLPRI